MEVGASARESSLKSPLSAVIQRAAEQVSSTHIRRDQFPKTPMENIQPRLQEHLRFLSTGGRQNGLFGD